jgi:hypothetical protein
MNGSIDVADDVEANDDEAAPMPRNSGQLVGAVSAITSSDASDSGFVDSAATDATSMAAFSQQMQDRACAALGETPLSSTRMQDSEAEKLKHEAHKRAAPCGRHYVGVHYCQQAAAVPR